MSRRQPPAGHDCSANRRRSSSLKCAGNGSLKPRNVSSALAFIAAVLSFLAGLGAGRVFDPCSFLIDSSGATLSASPGPLVLSRRTGGLVWSRKSRGRPHWYSDDFSRRPRNPISATRPIEATRSCNGPGPKVVLLSRPGREHFSGRGVDPRSWNGPSPSIRGGYLRGRRRRAASGVA